MRHFYLIFWPFFCQTVHIHNVRDNCVFLMDEQQYQGYFCFNCFFTVNNSDCNLSLSFWKLFSHFLLFIMLILDQNNSNQGWLMKGPIGFLKSSQEIYQIFSRKIMVVLMFKNTCFKINNGLLSFATFFSFLAQLVQILRPEPLIFLISPAC